MLDRITIEGYKSIRKLTNFELRPLNVLIGANGAGKSNFLGFFRLLRDLVDERLQIGLQTREGGADGCLYLGPKITPRLCGRLVLGGHEYGIALEPTPDNRLVATEQRFEGLAYLGSVGGNESLLKDLASTSRAAVSLYGAMSRFIVHHFQDTSLLAGVRRQGPINHDEFLHEDAGNLAALLHRIRSTHPACYSNIRDVVRSAAPFFDDFKLRPVPTNPDLIQLEWLQTGTDYPFLAHQLSDGTLRFICLATALLQPDAPPLMLFDEPELGLHPYALTLLANLLSQAADDSRQIIVSTQSAQLLNEFSPEDVVVAERASGQSFFRRLDSAQLSEWLAEYSLGELWQKNVLGDGPRPDGTRPVPDGEDYAS